MTLRLAVIAASLLLITGVGWKISNFFDENFVSKTKHERVLAQTTDKIEQKTKDATDEKKRIADEAAQKANAVPVVTPDDIGRLCKRASSCREHKG